MNKSFDKLSKKEKRIAIAKDALLQLKQKNLIPLHSYLGIYKSMYDTSHDQLNKAVKEGKVQCTGCIKAAGLLSYIMINNNVTIRDISFGKAGTHTSTMETLSPFWPPKNLDLMEAAYEKSSWRFVKNTEDVIKAIAFGKKFRSDLSRMKHILQNVIDNNGLFIP